MRTVVRILDRVPEHAVAVGLATALYGLGALLAHARSFDQDEFLHMHAAWSLSQGLIPYRDYFDQYTPISRVFLLPLLRFYDSATSAEDAIALLFTARTVMWLVSGVLLWATFLLGRVLRDAKVGAVAVLFLIATEAYWNKTIEIRPDTLATVFWLASLTLLVRAVLRDRAPWHGRMLFAWSGAFLALAFLTMQKVVFAFPGLSVGICWGVLWPRRRIAGRGVDLVACFAASFCLPLLVATGWFAAVGGLHAFIQDNFLNYLSAAGFRPYHNLHQLAYQHPFLALCGAGGLVRAFARAPRQTAGVLIVACSTVSLLIGLFIIPVPQYQYFVFFLPLIAVFAAAFLVDAVALATRVRAAVSPARWAMGAAVAWAAICLAVALIGVGAGSSRPAAAVVGYWAAAVALTAVLAFARRRQLALSAFLCAMAVNPLVRLQHTLAAPDATPYLNEIRYVMQHTSPKDTVMDGYEGSGVFRPHSWFHWFLAYNERLHLTDLDKLRLLNDLRSGEIAPKVVLLDHNLRDLSPAVTEYFEQHYEWAGTGVIWTRRR